MSSVKTISFDLSHLHFRLAQRCVSYSIQNLHLNSYIGHTIVIDGPVYTRCLGCRSVYKKLYKRGYCYLCFNNLAVCDLCVLQPHRCHFHLNTCREPDWGIKHCFQPHYVYLSYTDKVKIGITRVHNLTTRMMHQGAIACLPVLLVPSRKIAGLIEISVKEHFSMTTAWKGMLNSRDVDADVLYASRDLFYREFDHNAYQHVIPTWYKDVIRISYPLSCDVTTSILQLPIHDRLVGLKGMYMIFENGVFNMRRLAGVTCEMTIFDDACGASMMTA